MGKFKLLKQQEIPELKETKAFLYEHIKTRAQVLSLVNSDENKVFGISFRTPSSDSTGVAHIMEHSVLSGSKKYPLKDPFAELMKSSVATFLNAWTFPDKTCYPVASENIKDFYNIIDAYLDTVFNPLLKKETFEREGWHLELEHKDSEVIYKGIVFNEMKGSYSDSERVMNHHILETLFPDASYRHSSGGDPKHIPDLTYEQFLDFHRTYYHPSNARIFFYGNDDPEKRFELLSEYLDHYNYLEIDSHIDIQEKFPQPITKTFSYASSDQGESNTRRGLVTINWLVGEVEDEAEVLVWHILQELLISTPASFLRKALLDSGLGDDFFSGVDPEDDLRQMCFSVGLKGNDPEKVSEIEQIVFSELERIAKNGVDRESIFAAINTVEFSLREIESVMDRHVPQGLSIMVRALGSWLHDNDPIARIAFEKPLTIAQELLLSKGYIESMIQKYFLDNSHRSTVVLKPDPTFNEKEQEIEKKRLTSIRSSLSAQEIEEIINHTKELKERQAIPDSPEDLKKIPSLKKNDLDPRTRRIPSDIRKEGDSTILFHPIPSSGIVYIDCSFDASYVGIESLPYVSVLTRMIPDAGTEREDFVSLTKHIGMHTGGVYAELFLAEHAVTHDPVVQLMLRGKAVAGKSEELIAIMQDVSRILRLDDSQRLKRIVTEEKVRLESEMISSGHAFASMRLRAQVSRSGYIHEITRGISYYHFILSLLKRIDTEWDVVQQELRQTYHKVCSRPNLTMNVTTDESAYGAVAPCLSKLHQSIPLFEVSSRVSYTQLLDASSEAFIIPSKVNYVGKGSLLFTDHQEFDGSMMVAASFTRSTYLWDRVRVQGGAYGGMLAFDNRAGTLNFLSYRDPNLFKTLQVYDETPEYLKTLSLDESQIEKNIVAIIGDLDTYLLPAEKGILALSWYLTSDDESSRQKKRDQVFATTIDSYRHFGKKIESMLPHACVVVLGSASAIKEAETQNPNLFKRSSLLF